MSNPEYISIPRTRTKCPHSGLSRSCIYNLIRPTKANGKKVVVASRLVRLPGKGRGRRLVHYRSLMDYLNQGVVSVERLNLRTQWVEFRASSRRAGRKPVPVDLPPTSPDDLPDEAVFFRCDIGQ
jgi:hypothetical protein